MFSLFLHIKAEIIAILSKCCGVITYSCQCFYGEQSQVQILIHWQIIPWMHNSSPRPRNPILSAYITNPKPNCLVPTFLLLQLSVIFTLLLKRSSLPEFQICVSSGPLELPRHPVWCLRLQSHTTRRRRLLILPVRRWAIDTHATETLKIHSSLALCYSVCSSVPVPLRSCVEK